MPGLDHALSVYEEGAGDTPHVVRFRCLARLIQQDGERKPFGLSECLHFVASVADIDGEDD